MGHKSVAEAIKRFEQREREELLAKKTMLDNFKNERKYKESLQKLVHEQIKTYRYCRYSCYVLKKTLKETTHKYEEFLKNYKNNFSEIEIYLEELRHDSQEKIKFLKQQKNILKQELTEQNIKKFQAMYGSENSIRFDTEKMAKELSEFIKNLAEIIKNNAQELKQIKTVPPEKTKKLELLSIYFYRAGIKIQEAVAGRQAPTYFMALSVISEIFGLLRYAMPEYYGVFHFLKVGVDTPKEMIKTSLVSRTT